VATTPAASRVLLPNQTTAPLLHEWTSTQGPGIEKQPAACQEAAAWLKRARDRELALPICLELVGSSWLDQHGFAPLPEQSPLIEQLWLLLPKGSGNNNASRQVLRQLQAQIRATETMQNPHGTRSDQSFKGRCTADRCCTSRHTRVSCLRIAGLMEIDLAQQEFIGALRASGGSSGNGRLRELLGWSEADYESVKASLRVYGKTQ
jgi:hypothetical protein